MSQGWINFWAALGGVMLMIIVALPLVISELKLRAMSERKDCVKIVEKGIFSYRAKAGKTMSTFRHNVITFEFPDGSKVKFEVKPQEVYDSIQEGDMGTLTCKGDLITTYLFNRKFISFEKDK